MKSKWFLASSIPKHAVMQGKVLTGQLGDRGSTQGQEGFETRTKNQNQVAAATVIIQCVPLAYNQLHFEHGPDGTSWRAVCSLIYHTLSLRQIKWRILLKLPLILDHLPVGPSVSQRGFTGTPFLFTERGSFRPERWELRHQRRDRKIFPMPWRIPHLLKTAVIVNIVLQQPPGKPPC